VAGGVDHSAGAVVGGNGVVFVAPGSSFGAGGGNGTGGSTGAGVDAIGVSTGDAAGARRIGETRTERTTMDDGADAGCGGADAPEEIGRSSYGRYGFVWGGLLAG